MILALFASLLLAQPAEVPPPAENGAEAGEVHNGQNQDASVEDAVEAADEAAEAVEEAAEEATKPPRRPPRPQPSRGRGCGSGRGERSRTRSAAAAPSPTISAASARARSADPASCAAPGAGAERPRRKGAHRLASVKIGDRPRHPHHPVVAARREPHRLGRLGEQPAARLVGRRHLVEQVAVGLGIGPNRRCRCSGASGSRAPRRPARRLPPSLRPAAAAPGRRRRPRRPRHGGRSGRAAGPDTLAW